MKYDQIFWPAIGSERGIGENFSIDAHAPRGIFETADGNIYLVCDQPFNRFAVVLAHRRYTPFLQIKLSEESIDHGKWLGVGIICLINLPTEQQRCTEPGNLVIADDAVFMTIMVERGTDMTSVALGDCEAIGHGYTTWALVVGDRIVFQHDGTRTLFEDQLSSAVKEIM